MPGHASASRSGLARLPVPWRWPPPRRWASLGNLPSAVAAINASRAYLSGYAAHGRASDTLDDVLAAAGYTWSVQDGALQVLRAEESAAGVILLDSSNIIGSPTMSTPDKKGSAPILSLTCMLEPGILPGAVIDVDSDQHKGRFKVQKATHSGDTAGGAWYTKTESIQPGRSGKSNAFLRLAGATR